MRIVKYISGTLFVILSHLILISCNQNEGVPVYNPELVFVNSFKIVVDPYTYFDSVNQETIVVLGDSAIVADTVSSTPVFKWNNTISGLATVVISKELFIVSGGSLQNADQIIWQWHPGMVKGDIGKVAYNEGKSVNNKNILYNTQPLPLESGLYYWAVYGWDNSGREIIYSTLPLQIYVK